VKLSPLARVVIGSLVGATSTLAGVFLLLGLPWTLVVGGVALCALCLTVNV
jgi:hypothetical protein